MNRKHFLIALVPVLAVLGSCHKHNENVETPKYITVSTSIGTVTKVATNADGSQNFVAGDQISVYAWTGDANVAPAIADRVVNNSVNTLGNDGKWIAQPQMLWKNLQDKHYFVSVYPVTATAVDDLANYNFTVNVTDQAASDLLVATELNGKIAENNPVSLTFDHVMATVNVELSFRNQWGGTPTVENVTLGNVSTVSSVNLLTKGITASDTDRADVAILQVTDNVKYTSVIVPQTGVSKVAIKIGGKDFIYTHNSDFKFESGKITTIKLIVGRNQVDLGEVTINDWQSGDTIDGGEALD